MSKQQRRAPSGSRMLSTKTTRGEAGQVLANVAALAWEHRGSLMTGARKLWGWLNGSQATVGVQGKKALGRLTKLQSGADNSAITKTFASVAENTTISSPSFYHQSTLPKHVDFGEGLRVIGRQQMCTTTVTNTATTFLTTAGSTFSLSPDILGARLALIARTYNRYVFRHARLIYVPRVANTFVGSACMAYVQDGAFTNFATVTYATAQQVDPCVIFPIRESALLEMNYGGDECFYCESDATDSGSLRQTIQGMFLAYVDDTVWTTGVTGNIFIEYVVDLYQPVADLGFTVSLHLATDLEAVQKFIEALRAKNNTKKINDVTAHDAVVNRTIAADSELERTRARLEACQKQIESVLNGF